MADYVTKPPANLTTIKARNNGEFPAVRIMEIIDGRRALKLHGTRDMPVWGQELGGTMGGSANEAKKMKIKGDIQAIVNYLQTIQE